jgi:hypothetical protein
MIRSISVVLLLLCLLGCIHAPVDELGPSFATVKLIRSANFSPVTLGTFSVPLSKEGQAQPDFARQINIRGSTMNPPKGGDFSAFLKQTLTAELAAAGRLDAASRVSISAAMTKNLAHENLSKGIAQIAATFTVTRDGKQAFSRNYEVENRWKSEFIGAIAIPEAFRQYNELYGQLVRKLLSDPEFVAALSR